MQAKKGRPINLGGGQKSKKQYGMKGFVTFKYKQIK